MQLSTLQHDAVVAEFLHQLRAVRDQDDGRLVEALIEHDLAFAAEGRVADGNHLVDQIIVELDRHRHSEGQSRPHAARIGADRLLDVSDYLREVLDEVEQFRIAAAIDAGDEGQVLASAERSVQAALETQRPGYARLADDPPRVRHLRAGQEPHQRRLAGAIAADDRRVASLHEDRADVVQHGLPPEARRISLGDVLQTDHRLRDPSSGAIIRSVSHRMVANRLDDEIADQPHHAETEEGDDRVDDAQRIERDVRHSRFDRDGEVAVLATRLSLRGLQ